MATSVLRGDPLIIAMEADSRLAAGKSQPSPLAYLWSMSISAAASKTAPRGGNLPVPSTSIGPVASVCGTALLALLNVLACILHNNDLVYRLALEVLRLRDRLDVRDEEHSLRDSVAGRTHS